MNVVIPGHVYTLDSYDGVGAYTRLEFVRRQGPKYPGNLSSSPGTNCQEVLRVLIDRVQYLDNQVPCVENAAIIEHLREALILFESRALKRHGAVETLKTCPKCGHIACTHMRRRRPKVTTRFQLKDV